jgi:hypothetical protein
MGAMAIVNLYVFKKVESLAILAHNRYGMKINMKRIFIIVFNVYGIKIL